jgi:hypothetical protein
MHQAEHPPLIFGIHRPNSNSGKVRSGFPFGLRNNKDLERLGEKLKRSKSKDRRS